jgi:hypothetical protein
MFLSGNLKTEQIGDTHKLLEDVVYQDSEGKVWTVPKGYESDYASIPRALSWYYAKSGPYNLAAVVHDYLITDVLEKQHAIESNRVDEIFKEAMADLDIPKARQWVMWAGVRLGAIGNKKRRKGSLKTLPKVALIVLLALPVVGDTSLMVQIKLLMLWFVSLFLPKRQKIDAQKQ